MRDVMTVPYGETVSVHQSEYVSVAGEFRGVAEGRIIVDTSRGLYRIKPKPGPIAVLDPDGRELGFIEPDPPLPTTTPDLE